MKRKASAAWKGGLKDGDGRVSSESGALSQARYGFATRFEGEAGTNPEELVAAAHASCFAMALSGKLAEAKMPPETIDVTATVTLDKLEAGWTVTQVHLDVRAKVLGAGALKFLEAADAAKAGCPISRLLGAAAKITLDARLV